jgi:DNA-binding transcriptional LysR family regulator
MNLRQLEVFLAVVEHGSFSGAARSTQSTQSTISQHVAALETELGVQLLERSRNGIRLTDGGALLRKHARSLFGEVRATEAAFQRFRGLEETVLRIGASTIPGGYLVPPVLAELCSRFPRLAVYLLQGDSRETADRIASHDVEAGVVGARFDDPGFHFEVVGDDVIQLVVPRSHPWSTGRTIAVADLSESTYVVRESGSGTGRAVLDALRQAGLDPDALRVRAEVAGSEAIRGAVLAGVGIAFLSELAVRRDVERGDLVVVPVAGLVIRRPFYLVRRTGRELSPAATAFWDLMAKSARSGASR